MEDFTGSHYREWLILTLNPSIICPVATSAAAAHYRSWPIVGAILHSISATISYTWFTWMKPASPWYGAECNRAPALHLFHHLSRRRRTTEKCVYNDAPKPSPVEHASTVCRFVSKSIYWLTYAPRSLSFIFMAACRRTFISGRRNLQNFQFIPTVTLLAGNEPNATTLCDVSDRSDPVPCLHWAHALLINM